MDEIDDLTRGKLREWQMRRLEIKDRMQSHPEQTLELSKVLDLMDDEHAEILAASTINQAGATQPQATTPYQPAITEPSVRQVAGKFDLQLHVAANSPEDLRKLLEMALYELQAQIDAQAGVVTSERSTHVASMSGTLGEYQFELGISGESSHE